MVRRFAGTESYSSETCRPESVATTGMGVDKRAVIGYYCN
jgi:hypothetical protein